VHTDLLAAGLIEGPCLDENEAKAAVLCCVNDWL
jgi:hypothetical protein